MTEYPTIRIKCEAADMILAGRAAQHGLATYRTGHESSMSFDGPGLHRVFHVKRTKAGVSVRQIVDGRAV